MFIVTQENRLINMDHISEIEVDECSIRACSVNYAYHVWMPGDVIGEYRTQEEAEEIFDSLIKLIDAGATIFVMPKKKEK